MNNKTETAITFNYTCPVSFHMADPAGILFFGNIFTLFHQAFEHFVVNRLECPWQDWFQNPEWFVPIKQADAQFFKPILAGKECRLELSVGPVSNSSFTMHSSVLQKELCSSLKTVHVFCSKQNKAKMVIPHKFAVKLKSEST